MDFQHPPSLGVRSVSPEFSWIVPACGEAPDTTQAHYQINITDGDALVWTSGKVASADSTSVPGPANALMEGHVYNWTVTTWGLDGCMSAPSNPGLFVTSLGTGATSSWSNSASKWLSLPGSVFAYFRAEFVVPADQRVASAVMFIVSETTYASDLARYSVYLNGDYVDSGPTRSTAAIWGGSGAEIATPYATLDVTQWFKASSTVAVAVESMDSSGQKTPNVRAQIHLHLASGETKVLGTDKMWKVASGDTYRNPLQGTHGHSAGVGLVENIDANHEMVGWKLPGFNPDEQWKDPTIRDATPMQDSALGPKIEPPLERTEHIALDWIRPTSEPGTFIGAFPREFMGGLRLTVSGGSADIAGTKIHFACGESISDGNTKVGSTWGWEFDWTLRAGSQVLVQHKYMECRFVSLAFSGKVPKNFTLDAWMIHYPFSELDSSFTSNNSTLNAVWDVSRYTVKAASLSTYTDSNTRERCPYEADGIIAASARLLVQRDVLWARHSNAYVIRHNTWPVEWNQLAPFLAQQDYFSTGKPDLALSYPSTILGMSKILGKDSSGKPFLDSTGCLNTSQMGRHITDWMPDGSESDQTVALGEFTASDHMSVSNMYAAHGAGLLTNMLNVGGYNASFVAAAQKAASTVLDCISTRMWNGTNFCDGICTEVKGNSRVMSNLFALAFGLVPADNIESAYNVVTEWGLESIGDYGAFWYLVALSGSMYTGSANSGGYDTPGNDGAAIMKALAKSDKDSWYSGIRDDNLTMTRESWHDGTYSHEWGASPIFGVAVGLMGIEVTSPGWSTFSVKPRLGGLRYANITVSCINGFIGVNGPEGGLEVSVTVPCNTKATVCMPLGVAGAKSSITAKTHRLMLDGSNVESNAARSGHLCAAKPVGCGPAGGPRTLKAVELA